MTLNPLAFPKGVKLVCELCQKPAFVQCTKCRVTYYCCQEHQRADWVGIHEKICQNLIELRTPVPFFPSEELRQKRKNELLRKKRQMIDLTLTTGKKLLFQGKHEEAVPAAMQALRYSIDVHGIASIELVPSYLILGESSIGLGRLSQAEEYLAQADWTVLKTPYVSNDLKSRVYRILGLLQAAKGEFSEALRYLSDDIYHASEEYGPEDIHVSGGFFHMANIFFRQGRRDIAESHYREVTDIWYNFLQKIVKVRTRTPQRARGVGPGAKEEDWEEEVVLDEAQEAEAIQVLNAIFDMREHQPSRSPKDMVSISHTLAMLYFVLHDINKAKEFGRKAIVASETIPDDALSRNVVEFMKVCEHIKA